jgi:Domain of unknown function (DUF4160)
MPTIAMIAGIRILMFQRDHNPPHFHAFGSDFEAKFSIYPFEIMECRGGLRAKDLIVIRRWALAHHQRLLENWLRAQRGERIVKIEEE